MSFAMGDMSGILFVWNYSPDTATRYVCVPFAAWRDIELISQRLHYV